MNKDAYDLAPMGQPYSPYWLVQCTWRLQTREEPHPSAATESLNSALFPHSCFYLDPSNSAATANTVSCGHNHGAKAKPISMLIKLFHQVFCIHSDFFQSPYQKCPFSKEIFSSYILRIRKGHLLNTKYYTEHSEKLWKISKYFMMSKGYNPRVPFTDVPVIKCHWPNLPV